MTDVTDITGRLLTEIRDEIRGTNARLDHTNTRLDQAVERLDAHDRILVRIADILGSVDGRLERVERGQARLERGQASLELAQAGTNERLSTLVGLIGRAVERNDDREEQGKRIDAALEELRRKVEQLERRPGG